MFVAQDHYAFEVRVFTVLHTSAPFLVAPESRLPTALLSVLA